MISLIDFCVPYESVWHQQNTYVHLEVSSYEECSTCHGCRYGCCFSVGSKVARSLNETEAP